MYALSKEEVLSKRSEFFSKMQEEMKTTHKISVKFTSRSSQQLQNSINVNRSVSYSPLKMKQKKTLTNKKPKPKNTKKESKNTKKNKQNAKTN